MAVANGTVEIKVRITDDGQARAVRALNADLVEVDKAQVRAATSSKGMVAGYLGAQKGANDVKSKVDELLGIVAFAAPVVAGIGIALVEAFGPSTQGTLDAFSLHLADMESQGRRVAAEIERVGQTAIDSRIALLTALGESEQAQRLLLGKAVTAEEAKVSAAKSLLRGLRTDIDDTLYGLQADMDTAAARVVQLERDLASRTGPTINPYRDERAQAAERQIYALRTKDIEEQLTAAKSQQARAATLLAERQQDVARTTKIVADLQATSITPQVQEQARLAGVVSSAQQAATKAQASTASAVVRLLTEQRASANEIRVAQRDEFEIRKAIGLVELATTRATLEGEQEKVDLVAQQLALHTLMHGMSADTAGQLASAAKAGQSLASALAGLSRQQAVLESSSFRPGGGSSSGRSASSGPFAFRASNDNSTPVRPGLSGSAAVEAEYAAKVADAERRRTDAVARRTDLLRMQAAAPARERGRFEDALVGAGGDIAEQSRLVVQLEAEKQARLSELTRQGEAERAAARQAAQDEQIAGFGRVVASAVSAYESMQGAGSLAADWFVGVARTAGAVAENWKDLVAGKSGAILAIGEVATAGIKNEKTRAGTMVLVAVADGALAATRGDVAGVISAGIAATTYGIIAGSSGASGASGRAPARAPSVRASSSMTAGPTIINVNAPWIGSNPQEVGAYLERQRAAVDGTGYRWAA